jgi:hypothetical protein
MRRHEFEMAIAMVVCLLTLVFDKLDLLPEAVGWVSLGVMAALMIVSFVDFLLHEEEVP